MIKKTFLKLFIMTIALQLHSMNENHWHSKDIAPIQEVETKDTRALTTPDYYVAINSTQKEIRIQSTIFSNKTLKPTIIKEDHKSYSSILHAINKIKILEIGNTNTIELTRFTFYSCNKSDLTMLNEVIESLK